MGDGECASLFLYFLERVGFVDMDIYLMCRCAG